MAKNSIRDYDATSGNNTDVQSVDISEGCAASGINNAIREVMADLKDVSTGTVKLETPGADQLNVDNIRLDGNTISSTDTNGNVNIDPAGTGDTIIASGNVKIGDATTDVTSKLTVSGNGSADTATFMYDGSAGTYLDINTNAANGVVSLEANARTGDFPPLTFTTGGSERLRVDSSGILMVGKTSTNYQSVGVEAKGNGSLWATADGNNPLILVRKSSDGAIAQFYKDSSIVGIIGADSGKIYIGGGDTGFIFQGYANDAIAPYSPDGGAIRDNAIDLGYSSGRFDDIYATNGTIQTSDQNEKQDIASLTTAEMTAAKAISKLFKTYKWKDKVVAKGDAARTHTGVIAQEVQTAMSDAGLDASKYAFWCSDTWWETSTEVAAVEADEEAGIEARDAYTRVDTYDTADDAPEGATERTRLGVRYPELLAFIGAATEQRLADIETRLTALEA